MFNTYGDSNWKDKLTAYNGQSITYDAIGNPLSYRGYTLDWQNGRQLASLSGNGKTVTYTYDVDGLRTSKTVNGVKHEYYYVGSRLQYEKFGSSKLWFFYDADGNPSGVRYYNGSSTADYYFVCNWRGDDMANYAQDEIHPSVAGNEIIANVILDKLFELGLGTDASPVINTKGEDIEISAIFTSTLRIAGYIFNAISVVYNFFTGIFG